MQVSDALVANGLFYMGVYGGTDSEGIREDDYYEPKRFFSFFTDDHLKQVVSEVFDIHSFTAMEVQGGEGYQHYQSVILRKKPVK